MMGYERNDNVDSGWFERAMGEGSAYAGAETVLNPIETGAPEEGFLTVEIYADLSLLRSAFFMVESCGKLRRT
ncbi:hypothetical protein [Desulfuromonas thiophila]|uniref:hypothetical protein n=1 Tax=Desulfuromonas thiophila TaxID=57664 RepID=UPI0029F53183|nr:hypothetical protein [Desulfuromonas thiophila]